MIPEFMLKMDWELLRKQKQTILEVSEMGCFTEGDYDSFNGLIALIDAIQNYAVDEMGLTEDEVFDFIE